jgi:hypothetical protein
MSATSKAAEAFARYAAGCPSRIELSVERRPGNALNLEIGAPQPRCKLKPPSHWPTGRGTVTRWLASGGDALVLGHCSARCPLEPRFCDRCGHRAEHHEPGASWQGGCLVKSEGERFACGCPGEVTP